MQLLRKFRIVLWKNFLLKIRHWVVTTVELIVPLILFVILVIMRAQVDEYNPDVDFAEPSHYRGYFMYETPQYDGMRYVLWMNDLCGRYNRPYNFYLVPNNTDFVFTVQERLRDAIRIYCGTSGSRNNSDVLLLPTEEALVDAHNQYVLENSDSYDYDVPEFAGGAIFSSSQTFTSPNMDYRLRFGYTEIAQEVETEHLFFDPLGSAYTVDDDIVYSMHNSEGLWQSLLEMVFIQEKLQGDEPLLVTSGNFSQQQLRYGINDQKISVPGSTTDDIATFLQFTMPVFAVLSFMFVVPVMLKRIVHEKEGGVKEFMRMMGLPGWLHWTAWFITAFVSCLITVAVIMMLLFIDYKNGALFQYSDFGPVFITLIFYSVSLIVMMFAISAFWNNANLALTTGIVIHLVTFFAPYGVFTSLSSKYTDMSLGGKMCLCLFPNVGLWFSLNGMLRYESTTLGLKWENVDDALNGIDDELTLSFVWIMFIVNTILYWLILWYMDKVKPGPYGQALVPYFFVLPSYWCNRQVEDDFEMPDDIDENAFEVEPEGTPSIRVQNLRKTYRTLTGSTVKAVKDVTFCAYPGQLMALLGHNGAGKTTTMGILTGLHSSTGGTATVNGYDVAMSMDAIRGDLGLCPQHNMLFPSLTVEEHIFFFGMLKGLSWNEAKSSSKSIATEVMLGEKRKKMANQLSGGMKRKLHLGIAMVGNSKIILLDEPTSGMDPEARRQIWDLLQTFKDGRTLILTTHFMEEADVLGDRIAIMADGKIQCNGSSMFLKKAFGSGYRLTMTKASEGCDVKATKRLVRQFVPSASTLANVSGELALSLPSEEESNFTEMLKVLAEKKSSLGIVSFGLSVTTLEDVFLRIGEATGHGLDEENGHANEGFEEEATRAQAFQRQGSLDSVEGQRDGPNIMEIRGDYYTGPKLWFLQLKGLFTKRAIQSQRNFIMYFLMAMVPIAMALVSSITMNTIQEETEGYEAPELLMTLNDYKGATSLIDDDPLQGDPLYDTIRSYLSGYDTVIQEVDNLTLYPIQERNGGIAAYAKEFILGATVLDIDTTCNTPDYERVNVSFKELNFQFQVKGFHTRPMVRNLMSNILYDHLVPGEGNGEISVTYQPMVVEDHYNSYYFEDDAVYPTTIVYSTQVGVGWILFVATFLIFPIRERLTNAKQVQIMAGVHPIIFWISNLLWDLVMYVIVAIIVVGLLAGIDNRHIFSTNGAAYALFLIYFMFALGGILMAYVFSFATKSAPSSFTLFVITSLVFGIILPMAVYFLDLSRDIPNTNTKIDLGALSDGLRYTFTWLPCFPQTRAMLALVKAQEENNKCRNFIQEDTLRSLCNRIRLDPELLYQFEWKYMDITTCCSEEYLSDPADAICGQTLYFTDSYTNETRDVTAEDCFEVVEYFSWDTVVGINWDLVFMAIDFFIMLAFLVGLESGYLQLYWVKLKEALCLRNPPPMPIVEIDDDVAQEQEIARANMDKSQCDDGSVLIVNDMSKRFGKFHAVRGLNFTVKQGECFGFLGVNGAGKTTSFRMLTGDEFMSSGQASLYGLDKSKDKRPFMRLIGYCPQFDSIIEVLTGREMLSLFAHIRGIPGYKRKEEIQKWIDFVGLQKYADRKCGTYSGGNKRKLNVAQALVGDPPIIFLDEPSTGVDPVARRKLWDTIAAIKKKGQSVVLTSHSMEECEALCDRLAIMVNGQFRCFGGPQHLKNKFGQGFTVIIKLNQSHSANNEDGMSSIKDYIFQHLQQVEVKDEHADYMHFHIGDTSTPWHHLFQTLQAAKSYFPFIQDYSLSETSLEEVFLMFARGQEKK